MQEVTFKPNLVKPEIAVYLEELKRTPAVVPLTPELIRSTQKQNLERFSPHATFYAVDSVKDYSIDGNNPLRVRIYTPTSDQQNLPILVYYHGGGWVAGSVTTHDNICRLLAKRCNCIVISVDYPLAPEHKFPEIIQQCYRALAWAYQQARTFRGDPQRIGVAGDSSGGNIAATMTLMSKNHQPCSIIYQALICPVTNLSQLDTPSYAAYSEFGLSRDKMIWFKQCYLADETDALNPYASPLLAPDLTGLPPTLVISSEFDVLRDDAANYAQRLQQAGVATVYHCMKKMIHSGIFWALGLPVIAEDIDFICENIAEGLMK